MVLDTVLRPVKNQSYYLFLNNQMKSSPQGFARFVTLINVLEDKRTFFSPFKKPRKKNVKKQND